MVCVNLRLKSGINIFLANDYLEKSKYVLSKLKISMENY